jgi:protein O-GlcNAc transferase
VFGWLKSRRKAETTEAPHTAEPVATVAEIFASADAAREAGDVKAATTLYNKALAQDAGNLYALFWLASMRHEAGDLVAAARDCESGLAIEPDQIGLLLLRGRIAHDAFDPLRALQCYQRVVELDADVPEIDAMLADQYCFLGRIDEGVAAFERALARQPDSVKLQSNRLFVLNYTSRMSPEALFDAHRAWGAAHESVIPTGPRSWPAPPDPDRRLRIGLVSSDLRQHPVAFFVEPLLRHLDRTAFDVVCFDTSLLAPDAFTERLKQCGITIWRRVGDLDDAQLAETIRMAGIDLLVDLSGHTSGHRLLVFARKPAPVQATWLGYLNTTGLTMVDYRITDNFLDPEGMTEHLHTEALFRLPHHSCFMPAESSPPVAAIAAPERPPTFGSINHWAKVTPEVKDTWSALLRKVPEAKLVVIARGGQNPAMRHAIVAEFAARSVPAEQIEVCPFLALPDFLARIGQMDVTLDPFPYGGGTTTMQSLWMGVPVVTLAGSTAFARNSVGPLTLAGLGELVVRDRESYVETAAGLVRDREKLARLRSGLRPRMQASSLTNAAAFTRTMEAAFRAMWRAHCAGATISGSSAERR